MQYHNNIIGKLLTPVNRRKFKRIVDKYGGDFAAKKLRCWEQFIAILLGQITNCSSLREIEATVKFHGSEHYHLGLRGNVARSTLANANETRNWKIYRDLCYDLIKQLDFLDKRETNEIVKIIDSTPINLDLIKHPWAETTMKVKGLKTHVVYDLKNEIPVHFDITGARCNDITWAKNIEIEKGVTYVADKGYTDYNWWYEIERKGAFFVTRLKNNARIKNLTDIEYSDNKKVSSQIFVLTNKYPGGNRTNSYADKLLRKVYVDRSDEGKSPLVLVTNDFTRSATEISDLYKQRWQIELFFKWIKQNLKIKKFLGRSENAIRTQICIAIISFILLKIMQKLQDFCKDIPLKMFITIVKNGLFTRLSTKPPSQKHSKCFKQLHFDLMAVT